MRLAYCLLAVVFVPSVLFAQDAPKPEEWQKLYEDASTQLRAAQDRKAQLAAENSKLADQVKDLQSKLQQANAQVKTLKLECESFDDRTFYLTTYQQFWQMFLKTQPAVRVRWEAFLRDSSPFQPDGGFWFRDSLWPLSAVG